jgi:hypothetical protein
MTMVVVFDTPNVAVPAASRIVESLAIVGFQVNFS